MYTEFNKYTQRQRLSFFFSLRKKKLKQNGSNNFMKAYLGEEASGY